MAYKTKMSVREQKVERQEEPKQTHPIWADPHVAVPRSFRWTMTPAGHTEVCWWVKRLKTDYINKLIEVEVYDDAGGYVFEWIQSVINKTADQTLDLKHLHKNNEVMYVLTFSGVEAEKHLTDYDYKSNDVLTHNLTLHFRQIKRTPGDVAAKNTKNT